jgi:hypothetical protein
MHEDHWVHNSPYERNVMVDEEEVLIASKLDGTGERTIPLLSSGKGRAPRWVLKPSSSSPTLSPTLESAPVEAAGEVTRTHGATSTSYGQMGGYEFVKHTKKNFRLIDFGRSELMNVEGVKDAGCEAERHRILSTFGSGVW